MRHLLGVTAVCFFAAAALMLLSWTPYLEQLDNSAYDFTLTLTGERTPSSPTVIAAIDEESLARIGRWPWTRDTLARLLDGVRASSPRAIGFDLLLDDAGPDAAGDDALAAAIARAPSLVLATRIAGDAAGWRQPNPKFLQPHVLLGHVHADPDADGISRRIYTAKIEDGRAIPAFSLQLLQAGGFTVRGDFEQKREGATVLRPQSVNIRFVGGRQKFPQVSAWKILDGSAPAEAFRDRVVLIGLTADGLQDVDQWFTPFSARAGQKMSGVEIHANAVETFYSGSAISQVSDEMLLLALFALAVLLWWVDRQFEGVRFYVFALLMFPGAVALSWALMKYGGTWLAFPPFWAEIVFVVPALEALEAIRVNRDLDEKIKRLSVWDSGLTDRRDETDTRERIAARVQDSAIRQGWLKAFDAAAGQREKRRAERARLMSVAHRNARWRLAAVDFFNDDLVRFLRFNNAILSSIEDVIIVTDPAGHVVYQNPAASRLSGFAEDPAFAPDYLEAMLDRSDIAVVLGSVLGGGPAVNLEFVPSRERNRFYHVILAPISEAGAVISLHETTAQYELNQAKTDMVSLVSHELRTPLTSIRGYSEMLMKYDLVAEKGKPFLATIVSEVRRLNGLIQSFLDVAYIESGRQKIAISEFEIGPAVGDMADMLSPVAAERRIRLQTRIDLPQPWIRGDRLLLYQAVSNLITNAIKYSPPDTTVLLEVSNGNGSVRFRVVDEGYGIPANETAKIFEKFFRRGNKETRAQCGFGLGLTFVREVAVRHGGDVLVESEVGKGSTFTLWIPN